MRVVGWQRKLTEYILEAQSAYKTHGYKPGTFDCCVFAGDWVKVATGKDPVADYRGKYQNMDEAFALIEEKDGSLFKALKNRLGDPVHPAQAMRGDIAFREADQACGIYFTSGARMVALFLAEDGFALHFAKDTDHAFRVE